MSKKVGKKSRPLLWILAVYGLSGLLVYQRHKMNDDNFVLGWLDGLLVGLLIGFSIAWRINGWQMRSEGWHRIRHGRPS